VTNALSTAEIASALGNARREGDGYRCRCPLSEEHNNGDAYPSFSIREHGGTILIRCHSRHADEQPRIIEALKARGLWRAPIRAARRAERLSLSLAELSSAKKIPVEWLQDHGVADCPNRSGVAIGYFYEDGSKAERLRKRTALEAKNGSFWLGPKGVAPIPYGVWLLKDARAKRQLIIVEGETDCWALWFHGYPALGMPGANNINGLLLEHLYEIDCLYVVQEPDAAGRAFPAAITRHARKLGYEAEIRSITMPAVSELPVSSEEIRPPEYSDDALASRFAERFASTLRYVAKWGRWFEYDSKRWAEDATLRAFDLSRNICREAANEIAEDRISLAMAIASAKTVAAVERLSRSDRSVVGTVDQWDSDQMLLNTPGGAVNLRTGQVRPNRLDDYCTKTTAVGPADYADCPLWLSFLGRIFAENDELIAYVKRLCGYMLTGSTTEQQFCFFFGIGANGKSVLTSTLICVLGGYAKTTASETFMASKVERHLTEVADLRGARLVVASETETGRRWAESRLKEMTGATPISARFMRQDLFEYTPQLKLVIVGNHKPHLSAVDEAIRRRLHLVPFKLVVPKEERDLHLAEKLKAESPAILRWMIDGCLEWQAEGLNPPPTVREATDAYFENEDALGEWIAETCEQGANYEARIKPASSTFSSTRSLRRSPTARY
jgi:putative DNA primase/helicase